MNLSCAICESDSESSFFQKRSGVELVKCSRCGLVYIGNQADVSSTDFFNDAQKNFSEGSDNKDSVEYWGYPEFYSKYQMIFDTFFEDRWTKIKKVQKRTDSLLDIGCGYGLFLEYIKEKVPDVQGLDLNEKAVAFAKAMKQLSVSNCRIEDYKPERTFDSIVMCDVLEHVEKPKVVLDEIGRAHV